MLVYDATKSGTFDNVPRWLRELKDHANRDIVLIMVGNKADLCVDNARQVSEEQAKQMAMELDIPYIETSAKSGLNVDKAFISVIERIYNNAQLSKNVNAKVGVSPRNETPAQQSPVVQVTSANQEITKKSCCLSS